MKFRLSLCLGLGLMVAGTAGAAPEGGEEQVNRRIQESVRQISPDLKPSRIEGTPIPGLREVVIGGSVFYFSEDGRYMIEGDLVDVQQRRSLTEERRQEIRLAALATVPENQMLIYPAKGARRHVVTIFTDIDCPYCRKLHEHMDEMNAMGIEVRYLLMPRTQVGSPSYMKAVGVWCADKPLEAMTMAKRGQHVPVRQCPNPVVDHMRLAQRLGVDATPTMITSNGSILPGYMPPDQLLTRLQAQP